MPNLLHSLSSFTLAYLANSLWQLPLLLLATAAAAHLLRHTPSRIVYRLWVACFVLALALPALSGLLPQPWSNHTEPAEPAADAWTMTTSPPTPSARTAVTHAVATTATDAFEENVPATSANAIASPVRPPVARPIRFTFAAVRRPVLFLYAATMLFTLLRFGRSLWRTRRLLHASQTAFLTSEVEQALQACGAQLQVRNIRIFTSVELASPATIHWPHPVLLLPADWQSATPAEMSAAFSHEIAHIRRHDFLQNLLLELLAAPLAFHPALPWLQRNIREARELACDEAAATSTTNRTTYAHHLLQLAEKLCTAGKPQPTHALGIFEADILERRLMNLIANRPAQSRLRRSALLAAATATVFAGAVLAGSLGIRAINAQTPVRATDGAPKGWFLAGKTPQFYRTGTDASGEAFLASKTAAPITGFGTLMQSIDAENYRGKRLRFRASVRSENVKGWAGLWMRVDKGPEAIVLDNMQTRSIKGTTPWKTYDVVLDVPADATGVSFGTLIDSAGAVWLQHVSLDVVGSEVRPTAYPHAAVSNDPKSPVNLDFHQHSDNSAPDTTLTAVAEPPIMLPARQPVHGPSPNPDPVPANRPVQEPSAAETPTYEPQPAVDFVSIVPHASGSQSTTVHISNDNIDAINMSFIDLLERTYGVSGDRISGVTPAQADARFDIHAKIDSTDTGIGASGSDSSKYMLRMLVEKHFHVVSHTGSKLMPVDAIVVAKSGILIKPAAPGASTMAHSDDGHVNSEATSMARLAKYMSNHYRRTLIDDTGLKGDYAFDFKWPASGADREAIATALQQQLGLSLEAKEAPMKTLTVDQLELPGK